MYTFWRPVQWYVWNCFFSIYGFGSSSHTPDLLIYPYDESMVYYPHLVDVHGQSIRYIYTIHWSYEILYYPTSASFGRTNDSRDLGIRTIDRCEESLRQDQHNQEITRKKKDLLVLPQWYLTWTWWVIQTILFRYNLDSKSVVGAHVKYRHQIFFLTDA